MGDEGKKTERENQYSVLPKFHTCLSDPSTATSNTVEERLRQAISHISSLISVSHTIKVFPVKWQMIRSKLDDLNSGLIAAENCVCSISDTSSQSEALSGLVQALPRTLGACQNLANCCINVSFSGKLLMQSDLDSICAKLENLTKDLSGIYKAGILSNGFALVVSKPGFGASREDMKFYVKDLLTRLKVGDLEMKKQALISLNEIVLEDERYAKVIVDLNEVILILANFLDSSDMEIQEESVKVVYVISGFNSYRDVLVGSGLIAPLIRVLECGSFVGREFAIKSLQNLTENSENAWSVSAHGGVTALLDICSASTTAATEEEESSSTTSSTSSSSKEQRIGPACGVLRNLVNVEEIKRFMIEEGAISIFIRLIKSSKDEATQVYSIEFLQAIAFRDDPVREMIIQEGGIRAIVHVLEPKSSSYYSYKTKETALKAVQTLCFSSVSALNILVNHGFLDQLLYFLRKGEVSIQELSLKAACRLSTTSEDAKKLMGDAGFIPEFIKFLEAKSCEIREMAAQVLCGMVTVPKNRKRFVQDEKNIGLILQLLHDHHPPCKEVNFAGNSNLKLLLSILLAISGCSNAKRRIVNSDYMKSLEKLAEAGVSDAKKIVKKVSSNRLQRMFSKIIHT